MGNIVEIVPPEGQRNGLRLRADRTTGAWSIETAGDDAFQPALTVTFRGPLARERAMLSFRTTVLALDDIVQA